MNITEEKIDSLNALLKVKIEPNDYHQRYSDALNTYRRKLQVPGFRPGKAPMGMVKSRYGKAVLAEELNKMLSDSIQNYIADNQLKVLGSPIPSETHEETGDWDNPTEFEFVYEMGLSPSLDVKVTGKDQLTYYAVAVDDKMLTDHLLDITERYGNVEQPDEVTEGCMLVTDIVELDENGEIKPGGIFEQFNFRLIDVEAETMGRFVGLKPGDKAVADPRKLVTDAQRLARSLKMSANEVAALHPNFQFTVNEIQSLKPAELNQELFDKMFGEGNVNSEDEFRTKVRQDIGNSFVRESDQLFKRDITRYLINKFDPELPDGFLKRWIRLTNEKPVTAEEVEHDYKHYRQGLQWQLIQNELIGQGAIGVSKEDIIQRAKEILVRQYAQYGIPAPEEDELESAARRILAKEDQTRSIHDAIFDEKLIAYIRANASVDEKEVSFDQFVEMANN